MKRLFSLLALLLISACKDEPDQTPRPALSAPDSGPSAEVRVDASSGPVRIALEVHQTRVRLSEWKGAAYFRATVSNDGREILSLNKESLEDPYFFGTKRHPGLYLEVRDHSGKPVPGLVRIHGHDPATALENGLTREQLDRLKHLALHPEDRPQATASLDSIIIEPGKSASTPTWVFDPEGRVKRVERFAQVPFELQKPGRYTLSLVYDWTPTPEFVRLMAKLGTKPSAQFVKLRTPPVEIEVLP